ncbi:unnamed protein product [Rotaria socialis]
MTQHGSTSIDQQCSLIKESSNLLTNDQLKTSLDIIADELKKNKELNNAAIIQLIVNTISLRYTSDQIFSKAAVFDHQLFVIIRDYYFNLLYQWRRSGHLDEHSGKLFPQIALLFADLCCNTAEANVDTLKELVIHEPLIDELRKCLSEIATNGKHLKDKTIEAIDYSIRAVHYLEKGRVQIQNIPIVAGLLENIVKCVCSSYFINMFKKIGGLEKLDEAQTFLLDTCTDVISWHDAGFYNQTHVAVRTALLSMFTSWFQNYITCSQKLSKSAIKIIGQLCITLIGGNAREDDIFPEPIRKDYCKLIDQLFSMLSSTIESRTLNDSIIALQRVLTQSLYSLTMTNDLRTYIKSKRMIPLLLKLTDFADETMQFNVYRILAVILTEDDIKTLANPSKIANIFLRFLTSLIDDSSMKPRFHNLLRSLKILTQHDQIKEELTKQDVLPLLLRCSTESKFDPVKARLPALEILLALTFNAEAADQLKRNAQFLSNLKTLATSSSEKSLQRVAEGLLWKLEEEETAMTKPDLSTTTNFTTKAYHIMLSYSHSDKDLCYHIYDRLVQDQFRVWLDRDQMHGQTMTAMANAIENSEFVFVCMSDTYKQSAYCQSEAHYAFERRCHLIPLIIKQNYRPDGWLGILASGKIYVDFPKLGFEIAYERIKSEMARFRTPSNALPLPTHSSPNSTPAIGELIKATVQGSARGEQSASRNYPPCINQWTNDDVRLFLTNENFGSLLPVLGNMNGRLLHEAYRKCKTYWDLMFQTFKSEVAADDQQKMLSIDTYIRFLAEIEKYVPDDKTQSSERVSKMCILL